MNELHQDYFDRVATFGKPGVDDKGKPTKFYPVIKANRDSTVWLMWMCYFAELDMESTVSEMTKRWGSDALGWTVPTIDPTEFQPSWPIYSSQIEEMRKKLDGPFQGNEEARKAFVADLMKKLHLGGKKRTATPHDKRGADLAEVRELILEKRRNSPEYKKQQEAAEREAVKFSERKTKPRKGN